MELSVISKRYTSDEFIDAKPRLSMVEKFMTNIEQIRGAADFDSWKAFANNDLAIKRWRYFLSADPYTRWGLLKPKGYAGDAKLMDFAYRHDSVEHEIETSGELGQSIYNITSSAGQSDSARQRIDLVRQKLTTESNYRAINVISFAAGHARELELLPDDVLSRIERFVAIDADYDAITAARQSARVKAFDGLQCNILHSKFDEIRSGNFVYSLGLFDYLSDKLAERTLRKMWRCVAPNGKLLIANLADDAANLGYCEAIMDWWMIGRTKEKMIELGESVLTNQLGICQMNVNRQGCFYYLELERL